MRWPPFWCLWAWQWRKASSQGFHCPFWSWPTKWPCPTWQSVAKWRMEPLEMWGTIREGRMMPKCVVVRMDAGLSFANTRRLQEFCMRAMAAASKADSSVSHLILDCKSVNGTDMTGCEAIENLAISLREAQEIPCLGQLESTTHKGRIFRSQASKRSTAWGDLLIDRGRSSFLIHDSSVTAG